MHAARSIVKFSVLGFLAAVGALFLFVQLVPEQYWPIPVCDVKVHKELASPSKAMVAREVRTDCSMGRRAEMEAKVFIGTPTETPGQLVFAAPAKSRDRAGRERSVTLEMVWRSEDHLEITYPDEIAPTLPAYQFRRENFTVSATSIPRKMTSNPSLQTDRKPAAELTR